MTASRRWSEVRSIIAVALALLLPVGVYYSLGFRIDHSAKNGALQTCADGNETRKEVVSFIDSTVVRSERALQATIASPFTTPDQRTAARVNLAGVKVIQRDAHKRLMQRPCAYPITSINTPQTTDVTSNLAGPHGPVA